MIFRSRVFVFFLICFFSTAFAQSAKNPQTSEDKQGKKPGATPAKKPSSKSVTSAQTPPPAAGQIDEKLFGAMRWRQVGPFRGGRVLAVTGVPGDPLTFYLAAPHRAASGKASTDGRRLGADLRRSGHRVTSARSRWRASDHNVLYVGTGEACIRGNISYGNGVYKSIDAGQERGRTSVWKTRATSATIIVDPRNPDIVFVAALGSCLRPNNERGVFRTTDGGKTWQQVLYQGRTDRRDRCGVRSATIHTCCSPALWQVQRTPWNLNSGGPGSGLYQSTDGGLTWKQHRRHGLPAGIWGGSASPFRRTTRTRVYALDRSEGRRACIARTMAAIPGIRVNDDERLAPACLVLHATSSPIPRIAGYGLRAEYRHVPLDGRRQDVSVCCRAARRPPRLVDRSGQSARIDQRQRRRRHDLTRWRQDLVHAV